MAVDCPSGLDCDTGALSPHALQPDVTVTFAYAKIGHYQFPGADAVGELEVADIGVTEAAVAGAGVDLRTFLITPELVRSWMPKRPRLSHKGTFGKVLLAVGSESFPGAAYLSCAAAGRAGAGLVTGAVPRPIWPLIAGRLAEPTWLPLEVQTAGDLAGTLAPVCWSRRSCLCRRLHCVGAGLRAGQQQGDPPFRRPTACATRCPATVIDADGLNCMAVLQGWASRLPAQCVLTPHPAEMARLCQVEVRRGRRASAGHWHGRRQPSGAASSCLRGRIRWWHIQTAGWAYCLSPRPPWPRPAAATC